MLGITFKNLLKSKLLTLCLIAGFILSTAVVSAIPMYTKSLLNKYIDNIFANAEKIKPSGDGKQTYIYPATLSLTLVTRFTKNYVGFYNEYSAYKYKINTLSQKVPAPILAQKSIAVFSEINYRYKKDNQDYIASNNEIDAVSDFENHVDLVSGSFPKDKISENNELEVIVDTKTFEDFSLEIGKSYEVINTSQPVPLKIKISGTYNIKSMDDPFWSDKDINYYCRFIATENGLFNMLSNNPQYAMFFKNIAFETFYDYKKIDSKSAEAAYNSAVQVSSEFKSRTPGLTVCTLADNLKPYIEKERVYISIMWVLLLPVLLVVLYYIFMISGFIVEGDKDQIAVLKSRGAGRFDILKVYLYEGIIISSIAYIAGPSLGFLLCKLITRADGFMSFGSSSHTTILLSREVFLYSLCAVFVMLLTLLISVYLSANKSIVELRQGRNRKIHTILKFKNMDIILLSVSLYGYYIYGFNKNSPIISVIGTKNAPIDPLMYIVSTLFIIGSGLFIMRLYKYVMRLILLWGKRSNFPALYLSVTNVLKDHMKKNSAMLFIIMTVALSIFNIHIAKIINTSYENTIKYTVGTDLVVKGAWQKNTVITDNRPGVKDPMPEVYIEPKYSDYSKVDGIKSYTKVLNTMAGQVSLKGTTNTATSILAIIPDEFGKTAWFDSSLINIHWYKYLNLMTTKKNFILISRALSTNAKLKAGDTVYYKIGDGLSVMGVIGGVVDYWPGCGNLQSRNFVISNFNYMFSILPKYPYEVWIKKAPGVSDKSVYDSMRNEGIKITEYKSLAQENYNGKNDLFLNGTNAVLSLGFLSLAAITIMGFVIYWMISLKKRAMQFGIYRSLGLTSNGVSVLLILEQVFTLGSSVLIGSITGILTARLFLPLVKDMWYANKFVIPVKYIDYTGEYLKLIVLLTAIFIFSLSVLKRYLSNLKINQAIKLGDD